MMNTLSLESTPAFDVLDRNTPVHRHAVIEASAGTGKTFAIENLVIRFLIGGEQAPLPLERILVVTFTRAAARDLKRRIRKNIEVTLGYCFQYMRTEEIPPSAPDYLIHTFEEKGNDLPKILRHLEEALFSFDQAKIYTIHGFCSRMLKSYAVEGGVSLEVISQEDQPLALQRVDRAVRDFIRIRLNEELYSPGQLKILLKHYKKIEKLHESLLNIGMTATPVIASRPIKELLALFQKGMETLTKGLGFTSKWVKESFEGLAPYFKDLAFLKKSTPHENLSKLNRFYSLFDKESWTQQDLDLLIVDGLYVLEAFTEDQLMKKYADKKDELLLHPLIVDLKGELQSIVEEAGGYLHIFSRIASDCQQFLRRYQQEEEVFGHDDLLVKMKEAVHNLPFSNKIREAFDAVIIDEFQDTDPIQWEIFSKLFLAEAHEWKGIFQIVGDPKQSIYAFRQADIYTYLEAAERLGKGRIASLQSNYRSQPSLLEGLNHLFASADSLFTLPRKGQALNYRPVKAGKEEMYSFSDQLPNIQFWIAREEESTKRTAKGYIEECEQRYFLPAIVKEIKRLHNEEALKYSQCAILISDKNQSSRLRQFLESHGLPVRAQKAESIATSSAVESLREVIDGILHYKKPSAFKAMLASPIIGLSHNEVLLLSDPLCRGLAPLLSQCECLKRIFIEQGVGSFYTHLMNSTWSVLKERMSVSEEILGRKNGLELYRQLEHLAELLIAEDENCQGSAEWILSFLDQLEEMEKLENPVLKGYIDSDQEGVTILTNHSSKGLEFDVVFALGLITRNPIKESLVPVDEGEKRLLPLNDADPFYERYLEEIDAEKMRQLYVVLTRAKWRLYVPVVVDNQVREIKKGSASPIELLLAKLNPNGQPLYDKIKELSLEPLERLQQLHPSLFHLNFLKRGLLEVTKETKSYPLLVPPTSFAIPGAAIAIESFTSISQHQGAETPSEIDRGAAPSDMQAAIKTPFTLPSGKETGVILHYLLETIPFDAALKGGDYSCLIPEVESFLGSSPYKEWSYPIAEILYNAFTLKLDGFCLSEIDPRKVFKEKNFLYCGKIENSLPSYIKGVIDLFFEHGGKYYLLDWKSNWLGPTISDYQQERLDQAMKENQYGLQAELYTEAIKRYLTLFGLNFDECFGGVYYLFLRGLGDNTGVWYHAPFKEGFRC